MNTPYPFFECHPHLRLTPLQNRLWKKYCEDPKGRSGALLARRLCCSRQNISNVLRVVQKKVRAAADLAGLWEGNILGFFEKYNHGWAKAPLRQLVWNVLRNRAGESITSGLKEKFEAIEEPMLRTALELMEAEQKRFAQGIAPDVHRLSLAYNILISAFHIHPSSPLARQCLAELDAKIPATSWLLHRFVRRAGHLADPRQREIHKHWLEERIQARDAQGARFASYAIAYYSGSTDEETQRLLASDGQQGIQTVRYDPVLQRLYDNIQIPLYNTSRVWMDINFLRIALMAIHFPFTQDNLSPACRNALAIVCQKSLHSRDPFVVERAAQLLHTLQR